MASVAKLPKEVSLTQTWRYSTVCKEKCLARWEETLMLSGTPSEMFSIRAIIQSDQGQEVANEIYIYLFQLTDDKLCVSCAHHPQTNSAWTKHSSTPWRMWLMHVRTRMRTGKHSSSKFTPFFLILQSKSQNSHNLWDWTERQERLCNCEQGRGRKYWQHSSTTVGNWGVMPYKNKGKHTCCTRQVEKAVRCQT